MAYINIVDGNFLTPVECEGSGVITIDDVTKAMIVTRKYQVVRTNYRPLLTTPTVIVPDYQFPTCILIEEIPDQVVQGILFFTRVYAQIPVARTEPRIVSFTQPGKSAVLKSAYTGNPIQWLNYGAGSPYTKAIMASVAFTYGAGDPNTLFSPPALTQIFYNSPTGRITVDYVGDVYQYAGVRTYTQNNTEIIVEPYYILQGTTSPATIPASWIFEVNISRWRGSVWQMEVTTVPTS